MSNGGPPSQPPQPGGEFAADLRGFGPLGIFADSLDPLGEPVVLPERHSRAAVGPVVAHAVARDRLRLARALGQRARVGIVFGAASSS